MTRINYKLDDFEGPLDLLLTLISKNKMSIAQVEIITIINQYLDVIRQAQAVDLDIASDFIDMAARLIYLKSVYLLPKDEEGEKLKAELQGQLIEYSRAKQAAALMREMYTGDKMILRPAMEVGVDYTYSLTHNISTLTNAYSKLSARDLRKSPPTAENFRPIVNAPMVSVSSRIFNVLKGLMKKSITGLGDAFKNIKGKSEAVATFLAVLEKYNVPASGVKLVANEENICLVTDEDVADIVKSALSIKKSAPLSAAAMETLAIIAYNQPVSRAFIEQVRGIDSTSSVQTLITKGLVEEAGRLDIPGHPLSYRTTGVFLRSFGLDSLSQLPKIKSDKSREIEGQISAEEIIDGESQVDY